MKISSNYFNKLFTNPRVLAPVLFVAIGAGKTIMDYQEASPQRKTRTIVKNSSILCGSLLGFLLATPFTNAICKKNFCRTKVAKYFESAMNQTIAATINTVVGVLAAVYTNELMQKYVLNKPFLNPSMDATKINLAKPPDNTFVNFIKVPENRTTKTVNRVFANVSDLPTMKVFSSPLIALTGLSIANTKGYHNKLKRMISEVLANTMIPTLAVCLTAAALNDKKPLIKYPAIFLSLVVGSLAGAFLAQKTQSYISDKVDLLDLKYVVIK